MTVEIKIPWATVGIQQTPADMTLLGLGIGHTDKDGKDRESALWMNPGVSFQNAGNWQSVRLHKTQ